MTTDTRMIVGTLSTGFYAIETCDPARLSPVFRTRGEGLRWLTITDAMTAGYVTACLWADCIPAGMGENGETGGCEHLDMDAPTTAKARADCQRFYVEHEADVEAWMDAYPDPDGGHAGEYVGHNLYLNSAGHGVGFWDKAGMSNCTPELEALGERLSDACKALGEPFGGMTPMDNGDGTAGL